MSRGSKASRNAAQVAEQIEAFNKACPVGTRVRYFPILGQSDSIESKTSSEAWDICGTACVKIEGKSGGVAIRNLQVLVEGEDMAARGDRWVIGAAS